MSVEELISIERVEFQEIRERIQETYVIADLMLSKLFEEVLSEVKIDILPILNVKILLYVLKSIPFTDEGRGMGILEVLDECMKYQLYGKLTKWSCKKIDTKLKELRNLVLYDYLIEGSLKLYYDNQIEWELYITFNF